MTSEEQAIIKELTEHILNDFFCRCDISLMISLLSPGVIWSGAGECQHLEGIHSVEKVLHSACGSSPCELAEIRCSISPVGSSHILCETESSIVPDEASVTGMRGIQRITFIFYRTGTTYEITYIHHSVPFSFVLPEEHRPRHEVSENYISILNQLNEQNKQIELMLPQLPGGMIACFPDDSLTLKWISRELLELLGYKNERDFLEATQNSVRRIISPEDYCEVSSQIHAAMDKCESFIIENRMYRKNGSSFWTLCTGKVVKDSSGELLLYGFITDVSGRKKQEHELYQANAEVKQQAAFFTQLYNTVPCGIIQFTTSTDHHIINANKRAWEMYGYTEEEYWNQIKDPFSFVLSDNQAYFHKLVDQMSLKGGQVSYVRKARRKNGAECFVSVAMERVINADGLEVIQAVFNDVTEIHQLQKEREQEQLLENRTLRAAIFTAYPLILRINLTQDSYDSITTGKFIFPCRPHGSYSEVFSKFKETIPPDGQEEFLFSFSPDGILTIFKQNKDLYTEVRQKGSDGQYHWISIHVIHVDNPYADDRLAIMLFRILDSQRAEQERQEQLLRDALAEARAANSAKSDFLSRMSHDIRTPMNAVIGMSAIGQIEIGNREKVLDCFRKIDTSSHYLLSLINDILDMSRIEHGKLMIIRSRFSFPGLLTDLISIIQPQAADRGISFQVQCADPLENYYKGDALRLSQILMNLLSNSIKFTSAKGSIILNIREKGQASGYSHLEFSVSDTGIGMSEEFLSRLFQPFEQECADVARNKTGSGLGLSIVYSLVQLMYGEIHVKSAPGKGTAFTVAIPLELCADNVPGESLQKLESVSSEPVPFNGQKILLVEDNDLNLEIARTLLEYHNLTVDSAMNGQEAVNFFKNSEEHTYLAVLMDIRMPVMNGLDASRAIRSLDRKDAADTPVIAMSANAFEEEKALAFQAGMNAYLVKPLDMNILFHTLKGFTR